MILASVFHAPLSETNGMLALLLIKKTLDIRVLAPSTRDNSGFALPTSLYSYQYYAQILITSQVQLAAVH
jgi:hypothetical protein